MTNNDKAMALGKAEYKALDLINAQENQTARVNSRANAAKGVIARTVAKSLVDAGKARYLDGGLRITTWDLDGHPDVDPSTPDSPPDDGQPIEVPDTQVPDAPEPAAPAEEVTTPEEPKTNGRKAKADKSPYSTAPVAGRIKRHGKSRRTGTMTEIEDLLHKDSATKGKVSGSGRYDVRCLDHGTSKQVPDMTTAKPLQARTDQFCKKCANAMAAKDAKTDAA